MRKILFRAQAINRDKCEHRTNYKNGDWVYGLITRLYDERFPNLPAEMSNEYGVTEIEVDYKTIGQYIGVNDKNNKKIFEWDIVKGRLFYEDNARLYVVKYSNCKTSYYFVGEDKHIYSASNILDIEVLGNIWDNPELLRKETVGDEDDR